MTNRYLSAEGKVVDDFGVPFINEPGEQVYDGRTSQGPWAMMTELSWQMHGCGRLGTGFGQRYVRQGNGELHKAEG